MRSEFTTPDVNKETCRSESFKYIITDLVAALKAATLQHKNKNQHTTMLEAAFLRHLMFRNTGLINRYPMEICEQNKIKLLTKTHCVYTLRLTNVSCMFSSSWNRYRAVLLTRETATKQILVILFEELCD